MNAKANFELVAELRHDQGKGASRRLRRLQHKIPAIVYGGGEPAVAITLEHLKLMHALEHPSFYSKLLTLNLNGKTEQVVLKDLQRHHFKKAILHMDLFRVKPTDVIDMRIPLHFVGGEESPGVESGGKIQHHLMDLEVKCEAQHLPEFIEVDISGMVLDQIIHISDLKLPKGVVSKLLSYGLEHDSAVVSIHLPKVAIEEPEPTVSEEAEGSEKKEAAAGATANKDKAGAGTKDSKPAGGANNKEAADKGKGKGK